jgi:DNA mismatch endonuclease, patch repair protein
MSRIRSSDTGPEMAVRRALHAAGYRFRLHHSDLPGKPDIVLPRHKVVIFVHGCFWHQHGCSRAAIPKTRKEYWVPKLQRNVRRHRSVQRSLRGLGWSVITVWECEIGRPGWLSRVSRRLKR